MSSIPTMPSTSAAPTKPLEPAAQRDALMRVLPDIAEIVVNKLTPAAQRDALTLLLPDIAEIVVNKLTRGAVRAFAATSTAALTLVLELRKDLVDFKITNRLDNATARLNGGNVPQRLQRSVLHIACHVPSPVERQRFEMRMPLHAATHICSPGGCTRSGHGFRGVLTPATMRAALPFTILLLCRGNAFIWGYHRRDDRYEYGMPLVVLPPGMAALEEVDLRGCPRLHPMPLPESSAARVRHLCMSWTTGARLPEGMSALESVNVAGCSNLAHFWLPVSSTGRLRSLDARESGMRTIPAGTAELRVLWINGSSCHINSIPPAVRDTLDELNGSPCVRVGA